MKNVRWRIRAVLLSLALVLGVSGWYFWHPIQGELLRLALPEVAPPPEGTIRFAVIGDYGSGSHHERDVAQMIESWKPDFITTVGDNHRGDDVPSHHNTVWELGVSKLWQF